MAKKELSIRGLDKKISRTLKLVSKTAGKPGKEFEPKRQFNMFLETSRNVELSNAMTEAFNLLEGAVTKQQSLNTPQTLDVIGTLRNLGLVETSCLIFGMALDAGVSLDSEQAIRLSPNLAGLEAWRKKNGIKKSEFAKQLLADPRMAYESAGGDWLLKNGEPNQLSPLFFLFLKKQPRPKHLPPPVEAVAKRLSGDLKGAFFTGFMQAATDPDQLKTLAKIAIERPVFRVIIESLPRIVARNEPVSNLEPLMKEFVAAVIQEKAKFRELISAGLARIGTGILTLERHGVQAEALLASVTSAARQFRNLTEDAIDKEHTWVLESLAAESEAISTKLQITEEGARHFAIAFQKAEQGFGAWDILALTARNIGLAPIGQKGDTVAFNPLRHQDADGGRLPGDSVKIEEIGWMHGETVVRRAKVKMASK